MKCPIDNSELQMTERQNVEIDYCPQCRGVWLDRGELDKILERVEKIDEREKQPTTPPPTGQQLYPPQPYGGYYGKHGRRRGLLGELFDF